MGTYTDVVILRPEDSPFAYHAHLHAKRPPMLLVHDLEWQEPELHTPTDQPIPTPTVPGAPMKRRRKK